MTPKELLAMLAGLAGDEILAVSERHLDAAARAGQGAQPDRGAVAIIPVTGALSARGYRSFFGTVEGMAALRARLASAAKDPNVSAIVLDIDSPGGTVAGTSETAAAVAAAREAKPVVAIANGLAASAAYWIGSQATEFVMAPNSMAGSIGVLSVHLNWAKAYADAGVEPTMIRSGARKAEGHPWGPLDDTARAAIQARVDEAFVSFIDAVAAGRRMSAKAARDKFGDGRVLGAEEAVSTGLADRIATLDAVVADLSAGKKRAWGRRSAIAFY